jgi:hypothetical protein
LPLRLRQIKDDQMTEEIVFHAGPAARQWQKQRVFATGFLILLFTALGLPFLWLGLYTGKTGPMLIGGLCVLLALVAGLVRSPRYDVGAPLLSVSPTGVQIYRSSNARQRDPVALDWVQIAAIAVHHPLRSRPILRITPTDDAARALGLRGPQWRASALTRWTGARLFLPVDLFDCGQDALLRHLAEAAARSDGPVPVVPRWDGGAQLLLARAGDLPESAA